MNYAYEKAEIANGLTSVDLVSNKEEDSYFFRRLEEMGMKLNPKQIEIVRHFKDPLLVDSVAGSGKSSVVAAKISYLLSVQEVSGNKVLLVTYTSEGAKHMLRKAKEFSTVDKKEINDITSGTFHSVFLRLLREEGETRDVLPSSNITMKIIMKKLKMNKSDKPETVLSSISYFKNKGIDLDDFNPESKIQEEFKILWTEYEKYKKTNNFLDFTDMLILLYKKLINDEKYLNKIRNRFHFIIIDEYQDTNEVQKKIVELIAYPENNIVVVGDCNQTIFSFAGSRIANILDFHKYFPNTKTISLDVNYRSTNTILGLANAVIQNNKERTDKVSYSIKPSDNHPVFISNQTAEDEATCVVNQIIELERKGKKLKDIAILYRNNANSRAIFDELLMRDINFLIYGNDEIFYETPIIKPIISYLKLSIDPTKTSAIKSILPSLYLSKDKYDFIKRAQSKNKVSFPLEHILDSGLKPYQSIQIKDKIKMIKSLSNQKPIVAIKMIRKDYERYLIGNKQGEEETLHEAITTEGLDELESACARFETVQEFVEFVNKVIKISKIQKELQKNPNADCVRLMTIHKSKGLEFNTVYLLHCNEGIMPSNNALEDRKDVKINGSGTLESRIEEERRLMYVAITRAIENLTISSLNIHRGKNVKASRFIEDYVEMVQ